MLFPVPTYQQGYTLPPPQNTKVNQGPGRGVPDVAANASPDSGYGLTIDHTGRYFGTSAAAPMWAGLVALLVEGNGGKPVGFLNPLLYRLQAEGAQVCTPILIGNNIAPGSDIGFQAGAPWNACCGLGSPLGTTIAKNLGLMET
jgi:kumamolisin